MNQQILNVLNKYPGSLDFIHIDHTAEATHYVYELCLGDRNIIVDISKVLYKNGYDITKFNSIAKHSGNITFGVHDGILLLYFALPEAIDSNTLIGYNINKDGIIVDKKCYFILDNNDMYQFKLSTLSVKYNQKYIKKPKYGILVKEGCLYLSLAGELAYILDDKERLMRLLEWAYRRWV